MLPKTISDVSFLLLACINELLPSVTKVDARKLLGDFVPMII
jgi:hypothetical protein